MPNLLKGILLEETLIAAELSRLSKVNLTTIYEMCNNPSKNNYRDGTKAKIVKALNQHAGFQKYTIKKVFGS